MCEIHESCLCQYKISFKNIQLDLDSGPGFRTVVLKDTYGFYCSVCLKGTLLCPPSRCGFFRRVRTHTVITLGSERGPSEAVSLVCDMTRHECKKRTNMARAEGQSCSSAETPCVPETRTGGTTQKK